MEASNRACAANTEEGATFRVPLMEVMVVVALVVVVVALVVGLAVVFVPGAKTSKGAQRAEAMTRSMGRGCLGDRCCLPSKEREVQVE